MDFPEFPKMDHDEALAYGWIMLCLYFFGAILIWMGYAVIYDNLLVTTINPYISNGSLTLQTANAISWNVNIIRYCVPVILVFGFVFAINWAIYKTGGGMATFSTFWWGFLAFIIFTVAGLIMAFFGGMFIDIFTNGVVQTLPYQNTALATKMQGDIYWFINMYYLACDMMPVLGGAIFGQSIVKRVRTGTFSVR
jgi:hypothetical protein